MSDTGESTFELVVTDADEPIDLRAFDHDALEDLEEALADLLEGGAATVTIDLRSGRPRSFTVPEAIAALVALSRGAADGVHFRCLLASERAREAAERHLPGGNRAPREARAGRFAVRVLQGDITRTRVDAIVNASNTNLKLGAGVSGAIRRAASRPDALQADMAARAPLALGHAVVTASHGLPMTDRIIHVASANGREEVVESAYRAALKMADAIGAASIAVPALGTGTGGLATQRCAELLAGVLAERGGSPGSLELVVCVLYGPREAEVFGDVLVGALPG